MKIRRFCLLAVALLVGLTACLSGCKPPDKQEKDDMKVYRKIYDGHAKQKYEETSGPRYIASHGYAFNDTQGYNGWSYEAYDGSTGAYTAMTRSGDAWTYENSKMINGSMFASEQHAAVRKFTAPASGAVTVSGTVRMARDAGSGKSAAFRIRHNDTAVYPAEGETLDIRGNDLTGYYFSFALNLTAGDALYFVVSGQGEVYCNPVVDYSNATSDTLYYVPEWGYYGDLHEYYYDGTVNLYHLQNKGPDLWEWHMDQTKDMFRYETARVFTTEFVENHYMAPGVQDLVDYNIYTWGRDCTMFYDADVDKYRYIGLTYLKNGGVCHLSMRTSDGNSVWNWSTGAQPLKQFLTPADGEPECAAFRKIGKRWYLFCGISAQSPHGVGGISYWVGGENKTIDEVDWMSLPAHRLDGEDLCVPQIERVDEKWYLFGWMPRKYDGNLWGGYKNLSREVYQRSDGLLATRLDVMAQSLLNKGKISVFDEDTASIGTGEGKITGTKVELSGAGKNTASIKGTYNSTYITYNLKLGTATEAGYVMKTTNGREYRLMIMIEDGKPYLQIDCLMDPSHPVSARVLLETNQTTEFEVKAIVEGSIIEFYVNDLIALSGRTSMGANYSASLVANGSATFEHVTVNRLAQVYDIYD